MRCDLRFRGFGPTAGIPHPLPDFSWRQQQVPATAPPGARSVRAPTRPTLAAVLAAHHPGCPAPPLLIERGAGIDLLVASDVDMPANLAHDVRGVYEGAAATHVCLRSWKPQANAQRVLQRHPDPVEVVMLGHSAPGSSPSESHPRWPASIGHLHLPRCPLGDPGARFADGACCRRFAPSSARTSPRWSATPPSGLACGPTAGEMGAATWSMTTSAVGLQKRNASG
jgi:hypothetical protein